MYLGDPSRDRGGRVLTLCSLLPGSRAQCLPEGSFCMYLLCPFFPLLREDTLDPLALEAGGLVFPQDCNNQRVNSLLATMLRVLLRD